MSSKRTRRHAKQHAELVHMVAAKLRPPFGVILGAPGETAELVHSLPIGDVTCYQMDLFQAARLTEALRLRNRPAAVATHADLWDLIDPPSPSGSEAGGEGESASNPANNAGFQTLIYPVPLGGERALKLDMIEQAFHVLRPHGTLIVLSPYDQDDFFPVALKKVFGKVHTPMEAGNAVFWCQRDGERPRRRHEMNYHVRVDADTSYNFISRPGVFGYGFYDEGARALVETLELKPGQRVLDLGCGVGTNGILAARQLGPDGFVTFVDSNVRAVALAELNARALGVPHFETRASHTLTELPDGSFDAVLANPPYYAQGSIIARFVERSKAMLRRGGTLSLVTKLVETTLPIIQEHFPEPTLFENRGYVIFRTSKE